MNPSFPARLLRASFAPSISTTPAATRSGICFTGGVRGRGPAMAAGLLGMAALLVPSLAEAGGIRLWHQDAAAIARGNAFAATADTAAAIAYNPAGLTQIESDDVQFSAYGVFYDVTHERAGVPDSDTVDKVYTVAQLYYGHRFESVPVAVGLGVFTPYGLGVQFPDESPLRTYATKNMLKYIRVLPVVAVEILPGLSVAAGPTINWSSIDLARGLFVPGDRFRFTGDGWAVGANAGLRWVIDEQWHAGVNYASPTRIGYAGEVETRSLVPFLPSGTADGSMDFNYPQNITAGVSYRPNPKWNLEVNVDWTDWKVVDDVILKTGTGSIRETFGWESGWTFLAGATRELGGGWRVSTGYIFTQKASPDAYFTPGVPDFDFHVWSLGVGTSGPRWHLQATVQALYGMPRDVVGSQPTLGGGSADGRYEFFGIGFALSGGLRF